jgi:hypothetical protein
MDRGDFGETVASVEAVKLDNEYELVDLDFIFLPI